MDNARLYKADEEVAVYLVFFYSDVLTKIIQYICWVTWIENSTSNLNLIPMC